MTSSPKYNLESLQRGLESIEANILALENALTKERARKTEYQKLIVRTEMELENVGTK